MSMGKVSGCWTGMGIKPEVLQMQCDNLVRSWVLQTVDEQLMPHVLEPSEQVLGSCFVVSRAVLVRPTK